ncbi:hypothetical protein [Nocardiopsis ansamitocini]|uniref:hypothetical protein n=1 Tax=Nocardiopsis ansamitocini TaxID=1670832 RepID=UPI002555C20A|nr:hypothetical protein [Nocardiopsis ansamitocini]
MNHVDHAAELARQYQETTRSRARNERLARSLPSLPRRSDRPTRNGRDRSASQPSRATAG